MEEEGEKVEEEEEDEEVWREKKRNKPFTDLETINYPLREDEGENGE